MPSVFRDILKGYLRYALFGVGVWMVNNGIATTDQWESALAGLSMMILTLGYMAWVKVRDRMLFNTALAVEPGATPAQVANLVKSGQAAPALIGEHTVPEILQGGW